MSDFWSDIRFASRSFRRSPGFALAAVLVLGIGIGAVSLMFSTFNTVVLQPLPFAEPDRLVWVWGMSERLPRNTVSYSDYVDFLDGTDAFEALGSSMVFRRTRVLTGTEGAERVVTFPVSASLFVALGIFPEVGRAFLPEEEQTGHDGVAILSHGFWQRKYGGNPEVLGATITLDGVPAEVVGIMPAGFNYPTGTDVWFPLQRSAGYAQGRGNNNFAIVGRLREGVSIQQAQAQMDVVARNIADHYPAAKAGTWVSLIPLHELFFGPARSNLLILAAIISLVPLVACANVASLFLARAVSRRNELASRLALGASRSRLIRQLLTEGLVVALAGGFVGLAFAYLGGEALRNFAPAALPRLNTIGIDASVLAITFASALLMVPIFGLAPAIRGTDMRIGETLKVGGPRGRGANSKFRNMLVVAQVALSLMLMLASGLLVRSILNLWQMDSGFRTESVLSLNALLPSFRYESPDEFEQAWLDVHRQLAAVPGVRTVGFVDRLPLGGGGPVNGVWAAERPPASLAEQLPATRRFASEGYFEALGISLLQGHHFDEAERWQGSRVPGSVVINQALAQIAFPDENALGKTLVLDWDRPVDLQVIGITGDIRETGPGSDPLPTFYLPARWDYDMLSVLIVTERDPLGVAGALRQAIQEADDDITLSSVQTMQTRLSNRLFQPRFRSIVVGFFALVTLVLSAIGLYGVLAYFVRLRGHEISIRLALGSGMAGVAGLVLGRGMALVAWGIAIGIGGALAGARLLQSWLFGVGSADLLTICAVSLTLAFVALVACLMPTIRAIRLDPAEVMKAE
jgi:putative ABC transport system permease protein